MGIIGYNYYIQLLHNISDVSVQPNQNLIYEK